MEQKEKLVFWGIAFVAGILGSLILNLAIFAVKPAMAEESKIITAQGLKITDSKGNVRAKIGITEDGTPGIALWDGKGKARAGMMLSADGSPGISFYDGKGKTRVGIGLGPDGSPGIDLMDGQGKIIWSAP